MGALYPAWDPYGTEIYREPVRRSWLIVSVLDDALLAQAAASGADVIILDLEDGIHRTKKPLARERFPEALETVARSGAEVFVRPDIELLYADLTAAVLPGLAGVVLPKVSSADQVQEAEEIMERLDAERGLPGVLELHPCVETALGNRHVDEILAAGTKVRSASLGRADLVMDLGPDPAGEIHMMPYLMQRLILAARAAGVEPIGAWWAGDSRGMLASPEATLQAAERGRRIGFTGALCVHASQVGPLNRGFLPDGEDTQWAKSVAARSSRTGDTAQAETAAAERLLAYDGQCRARDEAKGRTG